MVPSGGIGIPIQRHPELLQSLGFSIQSLQAYGALWIAWPLNQVEVDKSFGAGAWEASRRAEVEECKQAMDRALEGPIECIAKARL